MRDITSALADFVGSYASAAKSGDKGERDMLSLACALENAAKAVRTEREGLDTCTEWHCGDCGKRWGVHVTVARERELWTPENCPPCYNVSKQALDLGKRSGWTDQFFYHPPRNED
jgi:hypothetical protein